MGTGTINSRLRLRRHADYQWVYKAARKQQGRHFTYFYALRPPERRSDTAEARVGITVGKAMLARAHDRNRMKRRVRECVRRHIDVLGCAVDVILHPRRPVLELESAKLDREVWQIFRAVRAACERAVPQPAATDRA